MIQAFTVLLVLQPSPCKSSEHLGLGAEMQELEAAMMLLMVAAQGPPNPKVTLLAWEVLKLQITGGWASIVGKHIIVRDHHIALVLIPLGTGHQARGIFSLTQSSCCHSFKAVVTSAHHNVHCCAPHPASL